MSVRETKKHIARVRLLLEDVQGRLKQRGAHHDISKMRNPELKIFNEFTPKLKETTYGTKKYKKYLKEMGPALEHHYAHNRHHPEHFENGVNDMTLVDITEMLCDWKAASERHADGNILKSIMHNMERFGIDKQLTQIFINTAYALWKDEIDEEGAQDLFESGSKGKKGSR